MTGKLGTRTPVDVSYFYIVVLIVGIVQLCELGVLESTVEAY